MGPHPTPDPPMTLHGNAWPTAHEMLQDEVSVLGVHLLLRTEQPTQGPAEPQAQSQRMPVANFSMAFFE